MLTEAKWRTLSLSIYPSHSRSLKVISAIFTPVGWPIWHDRANGNAFPLRRNEPKPSEL